MSNSGFLVPGKIGPVALGGAAAAADWWTVAGQTCVAAYQPKGAASLAASYVNLANPGTYDAAPGTAPTLAAGGWVGSANSYLTTGIQATNGNWSLIVCFGGASVNNRYMVASVSATFCILVCQPYAIPPMLHTRTEIKSRIAVLIWRAV